MLDSNYNNLIGNLMLSSAFVAYLGPFGQVQRYLLNNRVSMCS